MAEWIESSERDQSAVPELEPRRDEGVAARSATGEKAVAVGEAPSLDAVLRQRLAMYLIEREAICLRRLRWVDRDANTVSYRSEAAALVSVPSPERLVNYDRPPVRLAEVKPSGVRRVGAWLKSLFLGD